MSVQTGKPSTLEVTRHASSHSLSGNDTVTLVKSQISDFPHASTHNAGGSDPVTVNVAVDNITIQNIGGTLSAITTVRQQIEAWPGGLAFIPGYSYPIWTTVNLTPCLAFAPSIINTVVFMGRVPWGTNLTGGIIVRLKWGSSLSAGNVYFGAAIERFGVQSVTSDWFDTQVTVLSTANASINILTDAAITLTAINSIVAGDWFRLCIQRIGSDSTDTMGAPANLFTVSIEAAT